MIQDLITNNINLDDGKKFAAIIGLNPSNGARSPLLWNAAYSYYNVDTRMLPLDVTANNLTKLLYELERNVDFIGGALTIPYKEDIVNWLGGNITNEAKKIGAVNCLFRGKDGSLYGTNTDGEASILSYESEFGSIKGKSVLILGTGGVAKAVSVFFSSGKNLTIVGRLGHGKNFSKSIQRGWIDRSNVDKVLGSIDIVVNCTSLGFLGSENLAPLTEAQLKKIPKHVNIFDVIYQPLETKLISLSKKCGLNHMNGLKMNLEQAVLAFIHANAEFSNQQEVRSSMLSVD